MVCLMERVTITLAAVCVLLTLDICCAVPKDCSFRRHPIFCNGVTFEDSLQLYTVECINETAVSVSYEENRTAGEIELITLQYTCYNSTGNGESYTHVFVDISDITTMHGLIVTDTNNWFSDGYCVFEGCVIPDDKEIKCWGFVEPAQYIPCPASASHSPSTSFNLLPSPSVDMSPSSSLNTSPSLSSFWIGSTPFLTTKDSYSRTEYASTTHKSYISTTFLSAVSSPYLSETTTLTIEEPSSFTTESGSVVPVSVTVSFIIVGLISISALIISFLVAYKRRSKRNELEIFYPEIQVAQELRDIKDHLNMKSANLMNFDQKSFKGSVLTLVEPLEYNGTLVTQTLDDHRSINNYLLSDIHESKTEESQSGLINNHEMEISQPSYHHYSNLSLPTITSDYISPTERFTDTPKYEKMGCVNQQTTKHLLQTLTCSPEDCKHQVKDNISLPPSYTELLLRRPINHNSHYILSVERMEDSIQDTSANTRRTSFSDSDYISSSSDYQATDKRWLFSKCKSEEYVYFSCHTPNSPKYYDQSYESIELCYDTDIDEEL